MQLLWWNYTAAETRNWSLSLRPTPEHPLKTPVKYRYMLPNCASVGSPSRFGNGAVPMKGPPRVDLAHKSPTHSESSN